MIFIQYHIDQGPIWLQVQFFTVHLCFWIPSFIKLQALFGFRDHGYLGCRFIAFVILTLRVMCSIHSCKHVCNLIFENILNKKYSVQLNYIIPSPVTPGGGSALQPLRFCNWYIKMRVRVDRFGPWPGPRPPSCYHAFYRM